MFLPDYLALLREEREEKEGGMRVRDEVRSLSQTGTSTGANTSTGKYQVPRCKYLEINVTGT